MRQEALANLIARIVQRPVETTAKELIESLELDPSVGILGQLRLLSELLNMYQLELVPPLTEGEVDTSRLLR
jgi:hypothetical protein